MKSILSVLNRRGQGLIVFITLLLFAPFVLSQGATIYAKSTESAQRIWIDQEGRSFELDRYRGKSLLVFIGYTSCPTLCPMILSQMKKLEKKLIENQIGKDQLQILFITIDEKDSIENLKRFSQKMKLDGDRWTLAQAKNEVKNQLLKALKLNFNQKQSSGDHIRHSFSLVWIDREGKVAQTFSNIMKLELSLFPFDKIKN